MHLLTSTLVRLPMPTNASGSQAVCSLNDSVREKFPGVIGYAVKKGEQSGFNEDGA